jgi:hypothetical protein
MPCFSEIVSHTAAHEAILGRPPEIEGILQEPRICPAGPVGLSISYHWETADNRHTYLHLLLNKSPDDQFGLARANIDSEDIRGQGGALWVFLGDQLQALSDRSNFPIIHRVKPNDYSRHFPEADPRYVQASEREFYGVYTPNPVEQETTVMAKP